MRNTFKIKIKEATISDIRPFWNFFEKSIKNQFPEYSRKTQNYFLKKEYTKRNFKKWAKRKEKILLLALYKNEIIAYFLANPHYGGIAFILWMAVDKKFQRKQIGSQLLKKYEIIAKKQKAHKIHLWTDKRNLNFYKKNGYKLVGFIPCNYFGADDWLFYKEI